MHACIVKLTKCAIGLLENRMFDGRRRTVNRRLGAVKLTNSAGRLIKNRSLARSRKGSAEDPKESPEGHITPKVR